MPYSSLFKRGNRQGENERPQPPAPGYAYQSNHFSIPQTTARCALPPQPGPRLTAPPPLPPRDRTPSGTYVSPTPAALVPLASQPLQRYASPQQPPMSPPSTASLSPPIPPLQRSSSPQTYLAPQPAQSPPFAGLPRSPSPNLYPAQQPPAHSPQLFSSTIPSQRPITKCNPPKVRKILSLDGGGVRGLSIIKIMKYIMQELNRERGLESAPLDPWQEFDMIGGTSTGG